MRKLRSAAIVTALAAAMVVTPATAANAASTKIKTSDAVVMIGTETLLLSLNASGPKGDGGFYLSLVDDPNVFVSGRITCFNQLQDGTIILSGPITRDRGTQFGNTKEESNDIIIFTIDDNGSSGDLLGIESRLGSPTCSAPAGTTYAVSPGNITVK